MFTLVNDQGSNFFNDTIKIFITHFLFRHTSFITYYPWGNN
jgi:hypothetical protein